MAKPYKITIKNNAPDRVIYLTPKSLESVIETDQINIEDLSKDEVFKLSNKLTEKLMWSRNIRLPREQVQFLFKLRSHFPRHIEVLLESMKYDYTPPLEEGITKRK